MTLSLPKFRSYPPDSILRYSESTAMAIVGGEQPSFPHPNAAASMTISNYFLDNTDFTFDKMDFDYISGGYHSGGLNIDFYNAPAIGYIIQNNVLIGDNFPVSEYTKNIAMGYQWVFKNYCLNHIFTQASTNTTTRINILNISGPWGQQQIFVVALNGPNQGQKTTLQPLTPVSGFPMLQGPIPNPYDQTITRYYLPNHPTDPGTPDKVYYGLVILYGMKLNTLPFFDPSVTGTGVGVSRIGMITETVNINPPHVFQ